MFKLFKIILIFSLSCLVGEKIMALKLSSPAFKHNSEIPKIYTCEGKDISPPLEWTNIPQTAKSLVLIVDDPDAPDPQAPKMTWVHWVLYNLKIDLNKLPEATNLPEGATSGFNSWNRIGYGGPCPPIGRHRYFFKLYALDITLDAAKLKSANKAEISAAMQGHIIEQTELIGTYQKQPK